ncbi:MAG: heme o synthase [Chitinophagales bacterium]
MLALRTYLTSTFGYFSSKVADYVQLVKFRLSFTVVFSSVIAFAIASGGQFFFADLCVLFLGGFLITGASNALNQVFEKDYDRLMERTKDRPLAQGRMFVPEATLAAGLMAVAGITILWQNFNTTAAVLGAVSLILYAFVYTPLKRISPIAVFVGAIPGAMPPLIGWIAATGVFSFDAMIITSIQFLWQFPHFWAIGWLAHDDYIKAGYKLLPSSGGRDQFTALQCMIYIVILIPVSLMLVKTGLVHWSMGFVLLAAALFFLFKAWQLYRDCSMEAARSLMFASIFYLPVVLLAILIGTRI